MALLPAIVQCTKVFFMGMSAVGTIASFIDADTGLGREWRSGLETLPDLFMAIGGVLCARPLITACVRYGFGWFAAVGSTPAMAGCMLLGIDMGGNQLAQSLAGSVEDYYAAAIVAYSLGLTVSFNIPVGLLMISQGDRTAFALGTIAGILSSPISALVSFALLAAQRPMVNTEIRANAPLSHELKLDLSDAAMQLLPILALAILLIICAALNVQMLLSAFHGFGKVLDASIRLVFWACATELVTHCFTRLGVRWPFDPLLGGEEAGLEIAGTIAVMLTGIYPCMYILRTRCAKPLSAIGKRLGLCEAGACGCLASTCNTIAMFSTYSEMTLESKVLSASFMVCGSMSLGDYLAYGSVYQPGVLPAVLCGKLLGGVLAIPLAWVTVIPIARKLTQNDGYSDLAPKAEQVNSPTCVRSLSTRRSLSQHSLDERATESPNLPSPNRTHF